MLPMSDRYRTMSDTRSIGLRHNVRHVKNFFRNTAYIVRPPLSKKLFPVFRVGKKTPSREVGNLFYFPNFIFYKLECTGGKIGKKKFQ